MAIRDREIIVGVRPEAAWVLTTGRFGLPGVVAVSGRPRGEHGDDGRIGSRPTGREATTSSRILSKFDVPRVSTDGCGSSSKGRFPAAVAKP